MVVFLKQIPIAKTWAMCCFTLLALTINYLNIY